MHRLVATGSPASALLQTQRVVRSANQELAAANLLKVASQAKVRIPNLEHLGIDRTVRGVTGCAPFAQRFVLEYERSALCGMAAEAKLVLREQRGAPGPENRTLMRRMAGRASQPPLRHRMVRRQVKLPTQIEMALVADGFDGARRLQGRLRPVTAGLGTSSSKAIRGFDFTARIGVEASRPVAGLA